MKMIEKVGTREETGERKIKKERWMIKRIGDWKGSMVGNEKKGRRGKDRGAVLTRRVVMVQKLLSKLRWKDW